MAVSSKSTSKKLVRNPNEPSLKSQGAGYSTTNRKGETTFYKSSKDAPGYSDTNQSRSNMSKGTPLSTFDKGGKVITADKMKPVSPIPLATPTPVDGLFGVTNAANAGLAALNGGTYDTKTNQIVPPTTPAPAPVDNNQAILNSYLQANAGLEAPSATNNLKEMQKMLRPKEKEVNALTGQLNTLNAGRDAAMLSLEGQGRGQTGGFIGGEQARINREAAIQAMPIQAALSIAQDDLESARTYAGQYFQAKMQDETNIYNQKKENNRLVFEFLNAAEQRRVAANEKALDREYAEKQATAKSAEAIAMQAIEYGQSSLASRIMGLDPKSATYAADVRNVMAQLRKPVAAGTSGFEVPTVKTINGVDMQWNTQTGQWEAIGGATGLPEVAQKSLDQFNFLKKAITEAKDLVDATGPNMITQAVGNVFVGNTRVKQLQNKIDSLKTNLLTLNTDPNVKKFFGPQMSNKDTELLLSAGSTLDAYNSNEKANSQELVRYESLINRMEKAVKEGLGQEIKTYQSNPNVLSGSVLSRLQQPNIITTPDGLQIEIID